ncbi:hypothetical protein M569_14628 [Genlisea aurea]|uniref:Uncharacterized protein n=1 Tax=Genlisea aurea TaxID=192259 RepID=S8C6Y4_9LAMI|nr:hypothetical protein M569_14628 [Genlisea aurea]
MGCKHNAKHVGLLPHATSKTSRESYCCGAVRCDCAKRKTTKKISYRRRRGGMASTNLARRLAMTLRVTEGGWTRTIFKTHPRT